MVLTTVALMILCRTPEAARHLRNVALTMRLIKARTTIPIPEVYDFNASLDNSLGVPHVFIQFMDGLPLHKIWDDCYDLVPDEAILQRRIQAINDVAQAVTQLQSLKYDCIGSPQYDENDAPAGIGPVFTVEEKENGPFKDTRSMLLSGLSTYEERQVFTSAWLQVFTDCIVELEPDDGKFALYHSDLDVQNILVDRDGHLCAIIDWDFICAVPSCLGQANYPNFLVDDFPSMDIFGSLCREECFTTAYEMDDKAASIHEDQDFFRGVWRQCIDYYASGDELKPQLTSTQILNTIPRSYRDGLTESNCISAGLSKAAASGEIQTCHMIGHFLNEIVTRERRSPELLGNEQWTHFPPDTANELPETFDKESDGTMRLKHPRFRICDLDDLEHGDMDASQFELVKMWFQYLLYYPEKPSTSDLIKSGARAVAAKQMCPDWNAELLQRYNLEDITSRLARIKAPKKQPSKFGKFVGKAFHALRSKHGSSTSQSSNANSNASKGRLSSVGASSASTTGTTNITVPTTEGRTGVSRPVVGLSSGHEGSRSAIHADASSDCPGHMPSDGAEIYGDGPGFPTTARNDSSEHPSRQVSDTFVGHKVEQLNTSARNQHLEGPISISIDQGREEIVDTLSQQTSTHNIEHPYDRPSKNDSEVASQEFLKDVEVPFRVQPSETFDASNSTQILEASDMRGPTNVPNEIVQQNPQNIFGIDIGPLSPGTNIEGAPEKAAEQDPAGTHKAVMKRDMNQAVWQRLKQAIEPAGEHSSDRVSSDTLISGPANGPLPIGILPNTQSKENTIQTEHPTSKSSTPSRAQGKYVRIDPPQSENSEPNISNTKQIRDLKRQIKKLKQELTQAQAKSAGSATEGKKRVRFQVPFISHSRWSRAKKAKKYSSTRMEFDSVNIKVEGGKLVVEGSNKSAIDDKVHMMAKPHLEGIAGGVPVT